MNNKKEKLKAKANQIMLKAFYERSALIFNGLIDETDNLMSCYLFEAQSYNLSEMQIKLTELLDLISNGTQNK